MSEEKNKKEKKAVSTTVYLQYAGKEIAINDVEAAVRNSYDSVKKGKDQPKDIKIYLKPEEYKAFYVINCDYAGAVEILAD